MFYRCLQKRVSAQKLSREKKPKRYAWRSSVLIIPTAPSRHLHLNKQYCSLSGFLLQCSVVRMEALLWVAVQTRVPSTWTHHHQCTVPRVTAGESVEDYPAGFTERLESGLYHSILPFLFSQAGFTECCSRLSICLFNPFSALPYCALCPGSLAPRKAKHSGTLASSWVHRMRGTSRRV